MRDSDDTILLRGSPGRECGRGYICCEQQPKQRSSGAETDWDTEKKGPHIFTSRDGFVSFAITKPRHRKRCTYVYPDSQQYSPSFGIPFSDQSTPPPSIVYYYTAISLQKISISGIILLLVHFFLRSLSLVNKYNFHSLATHPQPLCLSIKQERERSSEENQVPNSFDCKTKRRTMTNNVLLQVGTHICCDRTFPPERSLSSS